MILFTEVVQRRGLLLKRGRERGWKTGTSQNLSVELGVGTSPCTQTGTSQEWETATVRSFRSS